MDDIQARLAEPFEPTEVKWKPGVVSGNRAMAMAYVDARVVQDRLDDVVGTFGWQDEYEVQAKDGVVVCKLSVYAGGHWVTKTDVGSPSEQPDAADRVKAAFSDALKRAAIKFGVGRYLYRLRGQWVDYDPQRKQFVRTPSLPSWALPKAQNGKQPPKAKGDGLPTNGRELSGYVSDYSQRLTESGLAEPGELERFLIYYADAAGIKGVVGGWNAPAQISWAVNVCKRFEEHKQFKMPSVPSVEDQDGIRLDHWVTWYDSHLGTLDRSWNGIVRTTLLALGEKENFPKDLVRWQGPQVKTAVVLALKERLRLTQPQKGT